MSEVTNTPLLQDHKVWAQATLPVRVGGLGMRSASVLVPSAYLSSSAATADFVHTILPATHHSLSVPSRDVALDIWSEGHSEEHLSGAGAVKERKWDSTKVGVAAESLLAEAADDEERARLLAAGDKISGGMPPAQIPLQCPTERSLQQAVWLLM